MVQIFPARDITLLELEARFYLQMVDDDNFFPEIESELPLITEPETLSKPQVLAYMLAIANLDKPTYGLILNGGSFIFVKLSKKYQNTPLIDYFIYLIRENCLLY